jgi:ubiquinone biosynthesis accessory factor UbiJ
LFLDACQRLLNRCVTESTAATERLAGLEGTSLGLEIEGTGLAFTLAVVDGEARLREGEDGADAVLRATPIDLLRLARDDSLDGLKDTAAELRGKVQVAEAYAELLRYARPDLEDELAGFVGDVLAHEIGTAARGLFDWGARAQRAIELDLAEYLEHEQELLVPRVELRHFYADVDRLRDDVERAEQRIAKLARTRPSRP